MRTLGEFILIDDDGDFWQGYGYYTSNPDYAKVYKSYEAADNACKKMKRRNFKITTWEDIKYEQ